MTLSQLFDINGVWIDRDDVSTSIVFVAPDSPLVGGFGIGSRDIDRRRGFHSTG